MPQLRTTALWALPTVIFCIYLIFATRLDIDIARSFTNNVDRFDAPAWCTFMYRYGLIPGQLLFLASASYALYQYVKQDGSIWQSHAFYITLTLLIGSLFIGHAIVKQFWKRPRPKQTICFGGPYPYCHPLSRFDEKLTTATPLKKKNFRSLPSGHATMGFYFFSLYFVGKRMQRRWIMALGLGLALSLGIALSWARMAQGGHFFSDVFASALIMWLTALFLDRYFQQNTSTREATPKPKMMHPEILLSQRTPLAVSFSLTREVAKLKSK